MKTSQYDEPSESTSEIETAIAEEPVADVETRLTVREAVAFEKESIASPETHDEIFCEAGSLAHEILSASELNLRFQDRSSEGHVIGSMIPVDVIELQDERSNYEVAQDRPEAEVFGDLMSPELSFRTIEVLSRDQNWSDSLVSLPVETVTSDAAFEPPSEMYYTASSEVSLLSDMEMPITSERVPIDEEAVEDKETEGRKNCVIAGHVAAMRERFESMTRANTPCPDAMRSTSPSLDLIRNITPSPDRLG